ncbi:HEAT repeat domain-containing protein [uncultured Arthrobacter sp.]|uniref:HEAT repeat domain-containing protein n=1 Tax=uncultured Arthrobacter sp. TaxID=114050 RepID=UPI002626B761|nr:HEAT repeat domain-containing protein [uncultured Arthrobacter sp.]
MLVSWDVLAIAVVVLVVGCIVALAAVVVIKGSRHARERRRTVHENAVRSRIMALAVAEDEALDALVQELASTPGPLGDHVEQTLLRMIPEVRGDVREAMISVLAARGLLRRSLQRISSRSAIQRAGAAELLGVLGGSEVIRPLTAALRDKNLEVRLVAARALGVAARPEAGGHLVDALSLTSGIPHSVAATALLNLPDQDPTVYIEGLRDRDAGIRYGSAAVVGMLLMSEAAEALFECLLAEGGRENASDVVVAACARSLGRLSYKPATSELAEISCSSSASSSVRQAAGEALRAMPGAEAREVRRHVMERADADVRRILVDA